MIGTKNVRVATNSTLDVLASKPHESRKATLTTLTYS